MCRFGLLKNIFLVMLLFIPLAGLAQSSCDKLFADGVKLQQTMTIAAQNRAIAMFEKAKVCYDSSERKNICDQQIKTSLTIIKNLKSSSNEGKEKAKKNTEMNPDDSLSIESLPKKEVRNDIKLAFNNNHLVFKAKGGEFKKVKVECNYDDWRVTDVPEWLTVSRNDDDDLVVETSENTMEEERAGVIKVECGDKEISLIINQKKYSKLERLKLKIIK